MFRSGFWVVQDGSCKNHSKGLFVPNALHIGFYYMGGVPVAAAKPNMAQGINNKDSNGNLSDDFDDFNLENELNTVPA